MSEGIRVVSDADRHLMCGCKVDWEEMRILEHMTGCVMHHDSDETARMICGCEVDAATNVVVYTVHGCALHGVQK